MIQEWSLHENAWNGSVHFCTYHEIPIEYHPEIYQYRPTVRFFDMRRHKPIQIHYLIYTLEPTNCVRSCCFLFFPENKKLIKKQVDKR